MDWIKLRDKFFKECTDASPNSGKNAGIRPVNLNAHNLFEWFRKECESKETSDESGNCIKPDVNQQRELLNAFAKHYNKLPRKDYIGVDDITDFLL